MSAMGMQVIKRDGSTVSFDRHKIVVAIQKANKAVEHRFALAIALIALLHIETLQHKLLYSYHTEPARRCQRLK